MQGIWREFAAFDLPVRLILAAALFKGLTINVTYLFRPLYIDSLGYDAQMIGQLQSVGATASLVASIALGWLAQWWGYRPLLTLAGLGTPLGVAGIALSTTPIEFMVCEVFVNIVSNGYWVAVNPILVDASRPADRTRLFSLNYFLLWGAGSLGYALGGVIVQVVAEWLGVAPTAQLALRAALLLAAALAAIGGLPLLLLRVKRQANAELATTRLRWRDWLWLGPIGLPFLTFFVGDGFVFPFVPVLLKQQYQLDPTFIGLVFSLTGITTVISPMICRVAVGRWGLVRASAGAALAVAPFPLLVATSGNGWLAAFGYVAMVTVWTVAQTLVAQCVAEQAPPSLRGASGALFPIGYSVGYAVAPPIGGATIAQVGYSAAFALGGLGYALTAGAIAIAALARRRLVATDDGIAQQSSDAGRQKTTR